jgi:hypothetical protein
MVTKKRCGPGGVSDRRAVVVTVTLTLLPGVAEAGFTLHVVPLAGTVQDIATADEKLRIVPIVKAFANVAVCPAEMVCCSEFAGTAAFRVKSGPTSRLNVWVAGR